MLKNLHIYALQPTYMDNIYRQKPTYMDNIYGLKVTYVVGGGYNIYESKTTYMVAHICYKISIYVQHESTYMMPMRYIRC